MKIQRMLSNGKWIDEDDEEHIAELIEQVLAREPILAPRKNREPMTTQQQVLDFLVQGNEINFDSDWYTKIRNAVEQRASIEFPDQQKKADCGHATTEIMTASLGTSCPNCYDRMS